jgi:hypothetical protein
MFANSHHSDISNNEKNPNIQISNSLVNKQIIENSHVLFYLIFCQGVFKRFQVMQKIRADF